MPPVIEMLWRQALKTFSGRTEKNFKLCQQNFERLQEIMNSLKAEDVNLDDKTMHFVGIQNAPMCVMDLFEDDDITIAIFILKRGITLPMHDHPGMHGLLKVLQGVVKIDTFTIQNDDSIRRMNKEFNAIKHPSVVVRSSDPPCVLTPTDNNLHEIKCIEGPAAFLDVISPPYIANEYGDGSRPCTFFRQESIISELEGKAERVKLVVNKSPPDFYSVRLQYQGPRLR